LPEFDAHVERCKGQNVRLAGQPKLQERSGETQPMKETEKNNEKVAVSLLAVPAQVLYCQPDNRDRDQGLDDPIR
jgi:hypothetical protein